MKKKIKLLTMSLMAAGTLLSASVDTNNTKDIFIDIQSKVGTELLKSEIMYKNYLQNEAIQNKKIAINKSLSEKNACEINKLKKALVKMIKSSGYSDMERVHIEEGLFKEEAKKKAVVNTKYNNLPILKVGENTNKIIEEARKKSCVRTKIVDTSDIEKSFYVYKTPRTFKVTRVAGTFKNPILGLKRKKLLKKGETFIGDMYTKAGWVHIKGGDWVKGYKVYPRVLNKTTKEDQKKWATKYITKVICK